jgi:hypothetical protein
MLFACALVCSKCLPLQVLQCGRVLAPVASTGTMKEPRCVAMLSLQLLFKGILRWVSVAKCSGTGRTRPQCVLDREESGDMLVR